ncbi:hypothetical protein [Rhizorhabdus argentea]|uniref:hypothetical protein n=1 Tax=Rhizorhabdus argentea TaxID=1387174 RepID=UPI0030EBF349
MRLITSLIAAVALASGASAATSTIQQRADARMAKLLEGRVAGKPVDCIGLRSIKSTEIVDGTAIVYRGLGDTIYVNQTDDPRGLDRDDILVSKPWGSHMCNLDLVRLLDSSTRFTRGTVSLRKFIPYTRVTHRG